MNDGTAFPFVWLGIFLATEPANTANFWIEWFSFTLLYKLAAGIISGYLIGRGIAYLVFNLPEKYRVLKIRDGFVGLSVTLLAYGIAEVIYGYGFIAVFVCAITLRNSEMSEKYHETLHEFSDQIERILVAVTLLIFGGALVSGILEALTLKLALLGICFLLVIRPLTTFPFLNKGVGNLAEKMTISFFGIRGIGSLFYISFALKNAEFQYAKELWSTVAFVILISILIHGFSANRALGKLTSIRKQKMKT